MKLVVIAAVVAVLFIAAPTEAQPDPQIALWMGIRKELSSSNGEQYFEANMKGTALPWLKGTLVSALIQEGVSRVVLRMAGAEEPEVTLIIHNGSVTLKDKPTPGTIVEFASVGVSFVRSPFMLTLEVWISPACEG